jgi:hypothetical protein
MAVSHEKASDVDNATSRQSEGFSAEDVQLGEANVWFDPDKVKRGITEPVPHVLNIMN